MTKAGHKFLSGNALKLTAALTMLTDHIGMILFPQVKILRIIGRLAFPIFAFFIAEGCRHTKNRLRYFLTIFSSAVVMQAFYYLYSGSSYMNIFVTFSLSILMIYALQEAKSALFTASESLTRVVLSAICLMLIISGVYVITESFTVSYGYAGCLAPVFASLFMMPQGTKVRVLNRLDRTAVHVIMLGICLAYISYELGGVQIYAFAALPLLLLYSGKRGKRKMKYFFYIFYPAHLAALQGLHMLLK